MCAYICIDGKCVHMVCIGANVHTRGGIYLCVCVCVYQWVSTLEKEKQRKWHRECGERVGYKLLL